MEGGGSLGILPTKPTTTIPLLGKLKVQLNLELGPGIQIMWKSPIKINPRPSRTRPQGLFEGGET
jgi:hypothetical protein